MAQFDIYENPNPETMGLYPYLLDVQADILADLPTRIVVPLVLASEIKKPIPVLNPAMDVCQIKVIMQTPQMASVKLMVLGLKVGSGSAIRDQIIAALDLTFTGY